MSISLYAVTFDCTNAADLARFWSGVLGRPVDGDPSEEFAAIGSEGDSATEPRWMFNKVSEPKRAKNRVHTGKFVPREYRRLHVIIGAGFKILA